MQRIRFALVFLMFSTLLISARVLVAEPAAAAAAEPTKTENPWTLTGSEQRLGPESPPPRPRLLRFQAVELRPAVLDSLLAQAPMEGRPGASRGALRDAVELAIPTPSGDFERFRVFESPAAHPALYSRLAEQGHPIRTYRGESLDRPGARVRLDWGAAGFHAMVSAPDGTYFVDPYDDPGSSVYASYFQQAHLETPMHCGVGEMGRESSPAADPPADFEVSRKGSPSTGGELRTFRAAFAVTGDYTARYAGGSAELAQSQLVTLVHRLNQVLERDLSVRFLLVAGNDQLIFTDAATDPYTESNPVLMLNENQVHLDAVIGPGQYDIGHVIYHGGLGLALPGVLCNPSKAAGMSGLQEPADEPTALDMVAHEVGHQLNASHTFNSANFICAPERAGHTAYEPGSGSTLMSYSGICGLDNIVLTSDHYYHAASLDQMLTFIGTGLGGLCKQTVSTSNAHAPTVTAMDDVTIPVGTAFELSVLSSEDLDGDTLTYTWEQFDLGVAADLASGDLGSGPILRSLPPSVESSRPVTGALLGEILPTTDRRLNFRVTVRDNHAGAGRIGRDTVVVTSVASAGPFRVTAPNGGEDFDAGTSQLVTWDVASTDGGVVNTPEVDILLSTDGGRTFPFILIEGTPNDGSETVDLPQVSSTSARIRVRGSGNIFFDTSDLDFSIGASVVCSSPSLALGTQQRDVVSSELVVPFGGTIDDLNLSLNMRHDYISDLIVTLEHVDSGTSVVVLDRPGTENFPFQLGCMQSHVDVTLDDEAPAAAEDQCAIPVAIQGIFSPYRGLSAFDGKSLAGTWRLSVETYFVSGGTVDQWCLKAQADDLGLLFYDGFESGDTSKWSPDSGETGP